jgi:hypothetical protein
MTVIVPRGRGVAIISVPVWRDDYDRHYHEGHSIALRFGLSMRPRRSTTRKQECRRGENQEPASSHSCGLDLCVGVDVFNGIARSFGILLVKPLCFPFPFPFR